MNENPPITWKTFSLAVFLALCYLAFILSIPMLVFISLALIMSPMELIAEYVTLCFAAFGLFLPHKWMRSLALMMMIYLAVAIVAACYDY